MPDPERDSPSSLDGERAILGAVLLDNHAYNEASEKLRAEDFFLDSHQRIFARMGELMDTNRAVDILTLAEELAKHKQVESVGGVAYLASLIEGLPRRLAIEDYVRIVKDKSLHRQLINACSIAINRAYEQSEDALEILNAAITDLIAITGQGIARGPMNIAEIIRELGGIENLLPRQGSGITGLATGFKKFDEVTCGLQPQELTIIAARPSMGKTALALDIARNAAVKDGKIVLVFSLEMGNASLLRQRLLASQAHVDSQLITKGFISKEAHRKVIEAVGLLTEAKLLIDDTPLTSLPQMQAKARRVKHSMGGLDLIVVDYLQLMSSGQRRYENRNQDVSAISRGLKALAKDLKVPVVALSQLSRASEQRGGDKKPFLSDLRESGSIEQDADLVAFIHRESYYNRDGTFSGEDDSSELIIAKQRNGPTGSVKLYFLPKYATFLEPAHEDYEVERPRSSEEQW